MRCVLHCLVLQLLLKLLPLISPVLPMTGINGRGMHMHPSCKPIFMLVSGIMRPIGEHTTVVTNSSDEKEAGAAGRDGAVAD